MLSSLRPLGEISQLPDPGLRESPPPRRCLKPSLLPSSDQQPQKLRNSWDGWPDLLVLSSWGSGF